MSVRGVSLRTVRWGGTLLPQAIERAMEWPATTMTAASGGIRELLLGPQPAKRKRKRSGCWEPQLVLVSEEKAPQTDETAQTKRAAPGGVQLSKTRG